MIKHILMMAAASALLVSAQADTGRPPVSQAQYTHPETAFTDDFNWTSQDLSGLAPVGTLREVKKDGDDSVWLIYRDYSVRVSAPVQGVLRLQVQEGVQPFVWPTFPPVGILPDKFTHEKLRVEEFGKKVAVSALGGKLEFSKDSFQVRLLNSGDDVLLEWTDLFVSPKADAKVASYSKFKLAANDHFFGLGGKAAPFDRRGRMSDIYSVKVETKRGDYGGFAMPFFVNPAGYGFILNNPYPRCFFDFGYADPASWSLTTPDGPLDVFLLTGPTFQEMGKQYHALTGSPAIPPKWMLGLWVSWLTDSRAEQWYEFMKRFREEKWPSDVTVLDLYWRGGKVVLSEGGQGKNLDWDAENFGDGPKLMRQLHDMNFRVINHVNTRMFDGDVLKEGLALGFLRKSGYQQVVSILETKESRDWNWSLYDARMKEGVDGWWVDNSERVDGMLLNGLPSRNLYGEVWSQFLFEKLKASSGENKLVLSRGGWLGTQTNATQWPGDTGPGVERLKEDLWFVGNLAMSGVPYSGVDLGGFKADGLDREIMHTDENIIRRVVHGFLLFPIPRLHNSERAPSKFPWRYDENVRKLYREYLELRYRLFPYYYSAAVKSSRDSVPMVRPMVFDYQDDPRTYGLDDQVCIGDYLLAAPIMETAAHSRYVYLPKGKWYDYWTGQGYAGERNVLPHAPLYAESGLPLFVKEGAIIPSRPLAQYNSDAPETHIHLDIYPADRGSFDLWEDENSVSRLAYTVKDGKITLTLVNSTDVGRTYTVSIKGDWKMAADEHAGERKDAEITMAVAGKSTVTSEYAIERRVFP